MSIFLGSDLRLSKQDEHDSALCSTFTNAILRHATIAAGLAAQECTMADI